MILQVILVDAVKVRYVKVNAEHHELVRKINGQHLQTNKNPDDINKIYELLGGSVKFQITESLGTEVDSPVGCAEFCIFFYN